MAETASLNAFRRLILAALCHTQPRIETGRNGIDVQFHIASPEGGFRIAMTLSEDGAERSAQIRLISRFLGWKLARGFIMTGALLEPPVIFAAGVSYRECAVAFMIVNQKLLQFSAPQWLSDDQMDREMKALLPNDAPSFNEHDVDELREWFGPGGRFPAVRMK